MKLIVFALLASCLFVSSVFAAPPDFQRIAALDSLELPASGSPGALYSPRLLVWPQLEKREDALALRVPGDAERILYQTEPLYTLGTIYGVAEGDWAVFTEIPKQASSPDKPRLVAIFIPRGSVYKYPLPEPLDSRYAYAPRLFGFPERDGLAFHWLALPSTGTARFGTVQPDRGIVNLTVDGSRLVAKTVDPKNYRGSTSLVYLFYALQVDDSGLPALTEFASRSFLNASDVPFYDAEEAYWHEDYTILAGANRNEGDAPFVALLPAKTGPAKALRGRILSYRDGLLAMLKPDDTIIVATAETFGEGAELTWELKTRYELPLTSASSLGEVVWITGAWAAGTQLALDLQVHLPGQTYASDNLGSPVLSVWDMVTKQQVVQLASVGNRPL